MKKHRNNFKLLDSYSYFVPGGKQIITICLFLLGGALIGNGIVLVLTKAVAGIMDPGQINELSNLIAYPIMFIPAMIYASAQSHRNEMFEPAFPLDGKNFGANHGAKLAVVAVMATLCVSVMSDLVNSIMPPMPDWLKTALETITDGNVVLGLLMAAVFAPFFEEWLCRGIILRGLLHCRRDNGGRGINPVIAIIISSAVFALIHANPWQAIPAFLFGLLFGYVYFKTGSLKLTMLMHCVNNAMSVILSHCESLKEFDNFTDILGPKLYGITFVACGLFLILAIRLFRNIPSAGIDNENKA